MDLEVDRVRRRDRVVVLHVVESFGAGTLSVLVEYVKGTPEIDHHVIRRVRASEDAPDGEAALFVSLSDLGTGFVQSRRAIRTTVQRVRPDVVHAHSSLAGAYARTAVRSSRRRRVVYTPHCFAFERRDVGHLKRAAFWLAELLFGVNTYAVAACSAREADLARRMVTVRRVVHVPNTAPLGRAAQLQPSPNSEVAVVGVGRISPQKGTDFFAATCSLLRGEVRGVQARWIGGAADADADRFLREASVEITGWVKKSESVSGLAGASVYLHTAEWEGMPVTLLEAVSLRVPVVVRDIPAFGGAPAAWTVRTEAAAAEAVALLVGESSGMLRERNLADWQNYFAENHPDVQRRRLLQSYALSGG